MEKLKKIFGGDTRQFGMIFALVALIILFQFTTDGVMLKPDNVINIFQGNAYILVLAVGMVLVIIAGHIDLSVGSVAAFAGIVVAIAIRDWGIHWTLGVLLGLVVGALIGAWQGFWVAYVGIPAFIVTLAGMLLFRGANQFDIVFRQHAVFVAAIVLGALRTRANQAKIGAELEPLAILVIRLVLISAAILGVMMLMASGRPGTSLPNSALILGVLVLVYGFVSTRTVIGRHVYAVGGNRQAAELSGVKSKQVNFLVMMNMSILAALAGMMFVARSTSSGPSDGSGWELDAIAAVFIGGAAVTGGVGTVVGAMVGGLVMAVLNNGLQLMNVGSDMQSIIKGLVLLTAVAFDVYNKSQGKRSILGLMMRSKAATEKA